MIWACGLEFRVQGFRLGTAERTELQSGSGGLHTASIGLPQVYKLHAFLNDYLMGLEVKGHSFSSCYNATIVIFQFMAVISPHKRNLDQTP